MLKFIIRIFISFALGCALILGGINNIWLLFSLIIGIFLISLFIPLEQLIGFNRDIKSNNIEAIIYMIILGIIGILFFPILLSVWISRGFKI
jgi:hypothetical protein